MTARHLSPFTARRAAAAAAAVGIGIVGLTGCSTDSAGPEAGAVSAEDLQQVEDQVADLENRLGILEDGVAGGGASADGSAEEDSADFFGDAQSLVGQQVTVSAEVSELITTTDAGSAFRIAGDSGDPVAVLSATPPAQLDADDVVQVSGTVVEVQRDTFEEDFGVAADELFEDAESFFSEEEGSVAVSADRIEVLQEQSSNG